MRKDIIPVYFLTFVNMLGFSIMFPVYPFILDTYNEGPIMFGLLISSYSFFQFLAAPILGSLSDKYGRRPILLVSQFGTMISWIIFAFAYFVPDIPILFTSLPILIILLSRVVDGITGGNVSVANAYLIDVTKPKERTKYFGITGAIIGIALILGPALGGLSSNGDYSFLGTVTIAFVISLVTLIIMYFYLPESLSLEKRDKTIEINLLKDINIIGKIKSLKNPLLNKLFSNRIFFAIVFSAYTSILTLYAKDRYDLDSKTLGILFLVIGIFLVLNQGFIVNKVTKRIGELKTYYIGQIFFASGLIAIVFASSLPLFLLFTYLNNLGISFSLPTFKSAISKIGEEKNQGVIAGIDESLFAISSSIIPIVSGLLYSIFLFNVTLIYSAILIIPFVLNFLFAKKFIFTVDLDKSNNERIIER